MRLSLLCLFALCLAAQVLSQRGSVPVLTSFSQFMVAHQGVIDSEEFTDKLELYESFIQQADKYEKAGQSSLAERLMQQANNYRFQLNQLLDPEFKEHHRENGKLQSILQERQVAREKEAAKLAQEEEANREAERLNELRERKIEALRAEAEKKISGTAAQLAREKESELRALARKHTLASAAAHIRRDNLVRLAEGHEAAKLLQEVERYRKIYEREFEAREKAINQYVEDHLKLSK